MRTWGSCVREVDDRRGLGVGVAKPVKEEMVLLLALSSSSSCMSFGRARLGLWVG